MSDDNADTEGYVSSSEYARLNNLIEFQVIKELTNGTLEGRVIGTSWYVKDGAGKTAEEITAKPKSNPLGQTAQTRYVAQATTKVRTVRVTGISIPFGDVLMVSFQFAVAGIILAIPLAFLILVISNS
jgi:hypothetical protein